MLATSVQSLYFYTYQNHNSNYWGKIGSIFGGPACYAFLNMLSKSISKNNIQNILFVARDGYTLKKAYDECFKQKEQTYYFYAPRMVSQITEFQNFSSVKCSEILRYITSDFEFNKIMKDYESYVNTLKLNNSSCVIVDTITSSLSAQDLIQKFCNINVRGYYYAVLSKKHNNKIDNKFFESFLKTRKKLSWANFIEFLFTAPEKPILYIKDNQPVYSDNISIYEKTKIDICPEISKAEIAYCKYISSFIEVFELPFNQNDIEKLVKYFEYHPSGEDIIKMKQIKNGIDTFNSFYVDIFPHWFYKIFKIFNFPVIIIEENYKKTVVKFLGIPIFKIKLNVFYLFGFLPVFLLKMKQRDNV